MQKEVLLIKSFVNDYCDQYGSYLGLGNQWKVERGNCIQDRKNYGLNALRTLDLLTQHKSPMRHEITAQCTAEDLGAFYTIELLSGTLLDF